MRARLVDQRDVFALAVVLQLAEILAGKDVGKAEDGVQRRAQLVADGRQEARLGVVGRFGLLGLARILVPQPCLVGNVARLGDDRAEPAVGTGQRRHLHAHVHELLGIRLEARAIDADVHGLAHAALAQPVDRGQEAEPVGDVDLVEVAARHGIAHPGQHVGAVAAVHGGDEAARIVQRDEAGEEVVGRGRARRGVRHRLGEACLRNGPRLAHGGRGGGEQRAGAGQRHAGRQRGRSGHHGGKGERQAGNGGEQRQRRRAQRGGRALVGGARASNASNGAQTGCHSVRDDGQLAQRKTLPFMFFSVVPKSHRRLKERINAGGRKGAKKARKSHFEAIQRPFVRRG